MAYPKHALTPGDLLHFIETSEFTDSWEELGLDDEDDLMALQLFIMAQPESFPIIKGTGGLEKCDSPHYLGKSVKVAE